MRRTAQVRRERGLKSKIRRHQWQRESSMAHSEMKLLCITAAAMALVVASSTAMAAPKKQSISDKATHRMKSPRSVPAPPRQWPPNNPTYEEYLELKRQGWYKEDKS